MSGPPPPYSYLPRPGMPPMPGMPPPSMVQYGAPPRPVFPMGMPPPMPSYPGPMPPRPQSVLTRPQFLSTMARPPVLAPRPFLAASERVPKRTTVYVGKIAPTVDDAFMRQLLEACGEMRSWKRVEDPETKQAKGFGFCEFEEADGCHRALRLLGSLQVDGQELLVKPDSATQKYLDEYQKDKEREAKERAAKKAAEAEQGELAQEESEEDRDNDVLVKIMGLVSDRAERVPKQATVNDRGSELLATIAKGKEHTHTGVGLPPPPPRDLRTERQIEAARALEQERAKEREMEREYERERERERKEEESKKRDSMRAYEAKVREWEKEEREIAKAREREREAAREAEREWLKVVRADLEVVDTDDELEPWARKPYRTSRRAEERRRRRAKEEVEDEEDRVREEVEQAERERREWEERGRREQAEEEAAVEAALKAEREEQQQQAPAFDPNDAIYQAMIQAAKSPLPIKHETPPHAAPTPYPHPAPHHQPQPSASSPAPDAAQDLPPPPHRRQTPPHDHPQPAPTAAPARKAPNLAAIFGDEEEDPASKRRKLVPLQYTEEEQRAVQHSATEDPKAILRRIADAIPTTREGVFGYKIKWDAYETDTMGPKLTKWVEGKIKELVGLEMPDVVQFIMELLQGHGAPQKMFDEVHPIIDTDAETFVIKLYRMVIFETEKSASGL